jgi:Carboxypeptidase regulatory-like domain
MRWRSIFVAAIFGALVIAAAAEAESEFANPGSIEGTVTKTGGTPLQGAEICAFDVAEDEEFTECALSKRNGSYEIDGLDEGPYRVEFKSGSSKLNLATQFWKGASAASKATIVRVEEGKTDTGIDATMEIVPVTSGVEVAGVLEPDIDGDSHGDLTQDRCPQSAAFHTACPNVTFASTYTVGPASIMVRVRASAKTPVAVSSRLPGSGGAPKVIQSVPAGKFATFSLPIPDGLAARRLSRLVPSRSLTLRLRAHAVQVRGAPSTDHLTLRIPGRG